MSSAEIGYRLSRATRSSLARLRSAAIPEVPPADLARSCGKFVHQLGSDCRARQLAAADQIIAGVYRVFDMPACSLGRPPRWNSDPLTGVQAPLVFAPALDYRDHRLVGNIKYLWEPNRHLHLPVLAQAYALTGSAIYLQEIRSQLESWMQQCPFQSGPNWTSSLELGIRLVNWSITWQLIGGAGSTLFADAAGRNLQRQWLASIYMHAWHISENYSRFSSANNHLIGEAAGVWVAAVTWNFWPQLEHWGQQARRILEHEALVQNAPDGGNREQAYAYQQFVLDFLLIAGLAAQAVHQDFSADYWCRLQAMIEFIAAMVDIQGNAPMIGDADDGYVASLSQEQNFCPFHSLIATGAVLFGRADLARKAALVDDKTRVLLGATAQDRFQRLLSDAPTEFTPRREFPDSGYFVLGGDLEKTREIRVLFNAGALGYLSLAAHGHADALAIIMNVAGTQVLVDPGTYVYNSSPQWRSYFRSTRAHNTVMIDGVDQSQQSGNFMWSRHAEVACLESRIDARHQRVVAEHNGYARLADPVLHRRALDYDVAARTLDVSDTLQCAMAHMVYRHWHFSESVNVIAQGATCSVEFPGGTVVIESMEPDTVARVFGGGNELEGGWISRSFGSKTPTTTVRWENAINGSAVLRTRVRCLFQEN